MKRSVGDVGMIMSRIGVVPIVSSLVKHPSAYKRAVGRNFQQGEILRQLAILLRERREKLHFSMNEVAARAGLSHAMVSRVEKCERMPTVETLLRMANALQMEAPSLLAKAIKRAGAS